MLSMIVIDGLEGITVNHGMTDKQVNIFCEDFLEVHKTDSLEDLKMMFKYLRRGQLGTIYNRLDVPTLFDAYKKYEEIRADEKDKLRMEQKGSNQKNVYEVATKAVENARKYKDLDIEIGILTVKKVKHKNDIQHFEDFKDLLSVASTEMIKSAMDYWSTKTRKQTHPEYLEAINSEINSRK